MDGIKDLLFSYIWAVVLLHLSTMVKAEWIHSCDDGSEPIKMYMLLDHLRMFSLGRAGLTFHTKIKKNLFELYSWYSLKD